MSASKHTSVHVRGQCAPKTLGALVSGRLQREYVHDLMPLTQFVVVAYLRLQSLWHACWNGHTRRKQ